MSLTNKIYSSYSKLAPNIDINSEQNFDYFNEELKKIDNLHKKKIIEIGYAKVFFLIGQKIKN